MRFPPVLHVLMLALLSCGVLACESLPSGSSSAEQSTAFKLPMLTAPRDSIELDIVFVDRPVSDPLLGKTLWREVDQVGTLSAEQRATIREAGILVGHVGSSPPDALQSLLNLTDQELERQRREANGIPKTAARRVALPAGTDTEVWSNEVVAQRLVTQPDGKKLDLANARGLLRLRAERSQDGWARLDFTPELHHGQTSTRPFAAATGWMYRTTQEVVPYYAQQFSVNLNVGEMLVLTCDRERPGTLGQNLFQFEDSTGLKQRLVVVRLAELREITPKRVRSE
ncbi:MAG: hypothetical protein DWI21_14445 [Planctomycetota bacterium]|nr:MAG: hypothetical protein DWI21_14445 [Planctomycetota bacterium]